MLTHCWDYHLIDPRNSIFLFSPMLPNELSNPAPWHMLGTGRESWHEIKDLIR